jgi:ppGpp synthetase/RelA/SpoT-type nucleotidyltranferase
MPLPASKKQVSRLGERLVGSEALSSQDADLFEAVIGCYDEVRSRAQDRVHQVALDVLSRPASDVRVTGRTKTTLTLTDKLRRTPEVKLPYIRDLAGIRVVAAMTLTDQDRLHDELVGAFDCRPSHKRVDRRREPIAGYRALHVVVLVEDLPVEVQIRTELQALWADLYERQADLWGRQVRYGGEPDADSTGSNSRRTAFLSSLQELSTDLIADFESHLDKNRPEELLEQRMRREAEAARLLKRHTRAALKQATKLRARNAEVLKIEATIQDLLAQMSTAVREELNHLADQADTIE